MKKCLILSLLVFVCLCRLILAEPVTSVGTAEGMGGLVTVSVTVSEDRLEEISVLEQNETKGIGTVAVELLPQEMVLSQSLLVDNISGATLTSKALKRAVRQALEEGGISSEPFEIEEQEEPLLKERKRLNRDVVVVGGGGAGLCAALSCAQAGAQVLLVEKKRFLGGNAIKAQDGISLAGTSTQDSFFDREEGGMVKLSEGVISSSLLKQSTKAQAYLSDTLAVGGGSANEELVRVLSRQGRSLEEWLLSLGLTLPLLYETGNTGHAYLHSSREPIGGQLVDTLCEELTKLGVEVMTGTCATSILMDGDRAVGILANDEAHEYTIDAKAVILATGGFGGNEDMMRSISSSLLKVESRITALGTGDGLFMAQGVKAGVVDLECAELTPMVIPGCELLVNDAEDLFELGGVLVNSTGRRFCDETLPPGEVALSELSQEQGMAYLIFDQNQADQWRESRSPLLSRYRKSGDTLEELGKSLGMAEYAITNMTLALNAWNEAVATGSDMVQRKRGLGLGITTAPFYGFPVTVGIFHTPGGVVIDENAQVIRADGDVIPGLYAAGEVTGGIHGQVVMEGNALADCLVFGRLAGQNAASFVENLPSQEVTFVTEAF